MAIEESRTDPVGVWSIVRDGRKNFGLVGVQLERFVVRFLTEMINAGAVPVVGDKAAKYGWRPVLSYGDDPIRAANGIVSEWLTSKAGPDINGIWLAFPAVWQD